MLETITTLILNLFIVSWLTGDDLVIEADVTLAETTRYPIPIMAHPPMNMSDITLDDWLMEVVRSQTGKGVKLDFKSTRVVEPAFRVLARHSEYLKGPLVLNADVLPGSQTTFCTLILDILLLEDILIEVLSTNLILIFIYLLSQWQVQTNPPWHQSMPGLSWCCVEHGFPKRSSRSDGLLKSMRSPQKLATLVTWLTKWLLLSRSTLCYNLLPFLWMAVFSGFQSENSRGFFFRFPTQAWQFGVTEEILSPSTISSFFERHSLSTSSCTMCLKNWSCHSEIKSTEDRPMSLFHPAISMMIFDSTSILQAFLLVVSLSASIESWPRPLGNLFLSLDSHLDSYFVPD